MRLNDSVARLNRAGDRNSKAWQKLREAIDQLADWLVGIFPGGGYINHLPCGYTFAHWQSKEYEIIKMDGRRQVFHLTRVIKNTADVIMFCKEIHTGLLDKIAEQLEESSQLLEISAEAITQLTEE